MKLNLRATQVGDINVKLMIRYEVEGATTNWCKYRFKRVELNLHVQEVF